MKKNFNYTTQGLDIELTIDEKTLQMTVFVPSKDMKMMVKHAIKYDNGIPVCALKILGGKGKGMFLEISDEAREYAENLVLIRHKKKVKKDNEIWSSSDDEMDYILKGGNNLERMV